MKTRFLSSFRTASVAVLAALIGACASLNDSTPAVMVVKDDFDDTVIVRQAPVSSADSGGDAWHKLGFEWNQKKPDLVVITVGTRGVVNINGIAFKADGDRVDRIAAASALTEYGEWSSRRFVMNKEDFIKVAAANEVKMTVVLNDKYTVSTFGKESAAAVGSKFGPFLKKVSTYSN